MSYKPHKHQDFPPFIPQSNVDTRMQTGRQNKPWPFSIYQVRDTENPRENDKPMHQVTLYSDRKHTDRQRDEQTDPTACHSPAICTGQRFPDMQMCRIGGTHVFRLSFQISSKQVLSFAFPSPPRRSKHGAKVVFRCTHQKGNPVRPHYAATGPKVWSASR